MKTQKTKELILAGLFIAIGLLLPLLTGQLKALGNMFLPMHLPVLVSGFVCGPKKGLAVGAITPLLRSALFGMPMLMPNALCMACELAAYGFVTGLMYKYMPKERVFIYMDLIFAMVVGRIVMGFVSVPFYNMVGEIYTLGMFITGAVVTALPGIIIQIILVPLIIMTLQRKNLIGNEGVSDASNESNV